ncbi:GNAT family N-acetyltransferase [Burkholderia territorii]|uniref:GNAT family N-acetyltransferase n=1 Tax=Burkholderia territorii TaxID=1503055 RepID=UPI0012D9C5A7|nr:GNAT family N-acetyltransferase [Burkholderia territorii]
MADETPAYKPPQRRGLLSLATLLRAVRLERATIRTATASDWPHIIQITNETMHDSSRSLNSFTLPDRMANESMERFRRLRWPMIVVDVDGEVIAYGSARGLRWGDDTTRQTAEVAIYLKREWYGTGAAALIALHLYSKVRMEGFELATCWIVEGNTSSIALAKGFGMTLWGTLPNAVRHGSTVSALHIYGASLHDSRWLEKLADLKARNESRIARLKSRLAQSPRSCACSASSD